MTASIAKQESTRHLLVRLGVKSAQVEHTLPKWQEFVLLALQGHIRQQIHLQSAQSAQKENTHQLQAAQHAFIAHGKSTMSA